MKAAEVDTDLGKMLTERYRIPTPQPATPDAMAGVVDQLATHFDWSGPVGVGFPGVVQGGFIRTAANLDPSWIDIDGDGLFTEASGCDVVMVNDADAAGLAEVRFGAGAGVVDVVVMVTLGTGIGSAVFVDGRLVPNTEFGHLLMDGEIAEDRASSRAKDVRGLSMEEWADEVELFLMELERLFWPKLFIIGGGISKQFDEFVDYFDRLRTPVSAAQQFNHAGIIGAALAYSRSSSD